MKKTTHCYPRFILGLGVILFIGSLMFPKLAVSKGWNRAARAVSKDTQPQFQGILIGSQYWMQQNLTVDTFRNGDTIPQARTFQEWEQAWSKEQPAWCYYNFDSAMGAVYGKLYNGYAVISPKGLAPIGWHIPSDAEWMKLCKLFGGLSVAGTALKDTTGWEDAGDGTNESGFSGRPGGYLHYEGIFACESKYAWWWSADTNSKITLWDAGLWAGNAEFLHDYRYMGDGIAVRCVRD